MGDLLDFSVKCRNLKLVTDGGLGSGLISRLWQKSTSSSAADAYYVEIHQSTPFLPSLGNENSTPKADTSFSSVYRSESFVELGLDSGIHPSLVASILCPKNMDCIIKVCVYIESINLNNGKQTVLAEGNISMRALLQQLSDREKKMSLYYGSDVMSNCYMSPLKSEFCRNADVVLERLHPHPIIGYSNPIMPLAAVRGEVTLEVQKGKDGKQTDLSKLDTAKPNPLQRQYVFYRRTPENQRDGSKDRMELDNPVLHLHEKIYEPRWITKLPLLVMQNYNRALTNSLNCWRRRRSLELRRKSHFANSQDALARGWHEVRINIVEAKFDCSKVMYRDLLLKRPYDFYEPVGVPDDASRGMEKLSIQSAGDGDRGSVQSNRSSVLRYTESELADADSCETVLDTKKIVSRGLFGGKDRADNTRPSTFVDITVNDPNQCFGSHIGRTNTEYYQYNPIYGSNIQSSCVATPQMNGIIPTDGSTIYEENGCSYLYEKYTVKDGKELALKAAEEQAKLDPKRVLVQNKSMTFIRYVPSVSAGVELKFDLHADCTHETSHSLKYNDDKTKSKSKSSSNDYYDSVIGTCSIPLEAGLNTDKWIPVKINNDARQNKFPCINHAEIHIEIQVTSPKDYKDDDATNSATQAEKAPSSLPFSADCERNATGQLLKSDGLHNLEDFITGSYEWLWHVGFAGIDPLLQNPVEVKEVKGDGNDEPDSHSHSIPRVDMPYPIEWTDKHILALESLQMEVLEQIDILRSLDAKNTSLNQSSEAGEEKGGLFRPSTLKKEKNVQALPINLHAQFSTLRVHSRQCENVELGWEKISGGSFEGTSASTNKTILSISVDRTRIGSASATDENGIIDEVVVVSKSKKIDVTKSDTTDNTEQKVPVIETDVVKDVIPKGDDAEEGTKKSNKSLHTLLELKQAPISAAEKMTDPITLLDRITCGCFTAHALGHKIGGLDSMYQDLASMKGRLSSAKQNYINNVISVRDNRINTAKTKQCNNGDDEENEEKQCEQVFLPYGEEAASLKELQNLTLSYEDKMLPNAQRRIYCLSQVLTVATNAFLIKLSLILEKNASKDVAKRWLDHGMLIVFESLLSVRGSERGMLEDTMGAVELLGQFSLNVIIRNEDNDENVLDFKGKQIVISLPLSSFEALPDEYLDLAKENKLIISFVPVLFTQGLDIQQSMENILGSESRQETELGSQLMASMELQHHVNVQGVQKMNQYALPLISESEESGQKSSGTDVAAAAGRRGVDNSVHPLLKNLNSHVRYTAKAEKNVNLLLEVERACEALMGTRITFCKSGKDRTGMVMTLEQSRMFGETFNCGQSIDRLLQDSAILRKYGARLKICEKNIGRPVYSINKLQTQFLPELLRPPVEVQESMTVFKKDSS